MTPAIFTGVRPWKSLNWPNRISLIRLLLVVPFVLLVMNQRDWPAGRYWAIGIFLVMAVSDFLDGLLARKLDLRTRLGAILDPLADKVLIICSVLLLGLPGSEVPGFHLPNWVVVAVIGKDLWVILGFLVIYLVTDRLRVHPTRSGKVCTFGQLTMVGCVLVAPEMERVVRHLGTGIVTAAEWVVAGLCAAAVVSYTRLGLSFIAKEQKPLEELPLCGQARAGNAGGKGPAGAQQNPVKGAASHDEPH
jgi:cardiolipin synthase